MNDDAALNPYQPPTDEAGSSDRASYTRPALTGLLGTAGFRRLVAAAIDFVAAFFVFWLLVALISSDGPLPAWVVLAACCAWVAYFFLFEWLLGATPGKMVMGLCVRQICGQRCSASQAAIRTVMRLVEVNPLALGAIPAIVSMLVTRRRQRLGDWLAGTVVIQKSRVRLSDEAS